MAKVAFVWGGVGLAVLALLGFGGWIYSLPAATVAAHAPSVPQTETDAMLASLRPSRRARPLITVIGINDATEATD